VCRRFAFQCRRFASANAIVGYGAAKCAIVQRHLDGQLASSCLSSVMPDGIFYKRLQQHGRYIYAFGIDGVRTQYGNIEMLLKPQLLQLNVQLRQSSSSAG
jgi:hypothetical protein